MASEIYVNSNSPIKTKIYWQGELVTADSSVVADIYDVTEDPAIDPALNPATLIDSFTANELEVDPGTYQVVLPFSYFSRNRKFKIVWNYEINSEEVSHITYTSVVTPYANIAEVIDDLNYGSDPTDPNYKTYHDLQMAEKYARKIIENYCNQLFYLYDDVQIAYGSGTDLLPLPFKLFQLHELYGNDILLINNVSNPTVNNWLFNPIISETGFGIRVDRTGTLDNTVYIANGMVPPTINDSDGYGAFRKDVRYRVQGRFGWETVPDNVEEACTVLMGEFFNKDSVWKNKYIKNIQTFDWQFEYDTAVFSGTGNAYVDQLLNPYVVNGMVVI
jgi:hypothetical protein